MEWDVFVPFGKRMIFSLGGYLVISIIKTQTGTMVLNLNLKQKI